MTKDVRHEREATGESDQTGFGSEDHLCPRCGGEMVATTHGIRSMFPSPALERLACSVSDCNYVKYVKMDSSGFATEGLSAKRKGDRSA